MVAMLHHMAEVEVAVVLHLQVLLVEVVIKELLL
jgi:hypothetical protein